MKIKTRQNKKEAIESFVNSADSHHVTDSYSKEIELKNKKYKRVTFSLDEETKKIIELLSIRSTNCKTSNSDIVKIAVKYLDVLAQEEFDAVLKKLK